MLNINLNFVYYCNKFESLQYSKYGGYNLYPRITYQIVQKQNIERGLAYGYK